MPPSTIYLALGSNLGDRRALLDGALIALSAGGVRLDARSAIYETDAVADHAQPAYLNQVVRGRTDLTPSALLQLCLEVERQAGRVRPPDRARAARTLDIDILLYDAAALTTPALTIPHPRLLQRPFVRIPLADVATPGLRHPLTNEPLDRAPHDPGVRVAPDS